LPPQAFSQTPVYDCSQNNENAPMSRYGRLKPVNKKMRFSQSFFAFVSFQHHPKIIRLNVIICL
jgi:hypothetical protein